jgi:type VI secretion system protein ImpD
VIHLKSHYTVDHLVSELKLTTSLNQVGFAING